MENTNNNNRISNINFINQQNAEKAIKEASDYIESIQDDPKAEIKVDTKFIYVNPPIEWADVGVYVCGEKVNVLSITYPGRNLRNSEFCNLPIHFSGNVTTDEKTMLEFKNYMKGLSIFPRPPLIK